MKLKKDFRLNDISIKWQLMALCMVLIAVPVIGIGLSSYTAAQTETLKQVERNLQEQALMIAKDTKNVYEVAQENIKNSLNAAEKIALEGIVSKRTVELDETVSVRITAVNQITQESQTVTIPKLKINNTSVMEDHTMVDQVKESLGVSATIFQFIPQGIIRVSTTVTKDDGTRAVGTYIPTDSPVYQSVVKGETYYGRAFVVNQWYITGYTPIKDADGRSIGVLYVGIPESKYKEVIKNNLSQIIIGQTGYVYILDGEGKYELSYARERDGEDLWDSKDAHGNLFIQNIISQAKANGDGETAIFRYDWKNSGERETRTKITGITYFPEWDWVIAASAYEQDFLGSLSRIRNVTIIIGILAITIGSAIAYVFANYLTGILHLLVKKMDRVASGDLRIEDEHHAEGKNEIGRLSVSFAAMVTNIKDLISKIVINADTSAASAQELSASAQQVSAAIQQVASTIQQVASGAETTSKEAMEAQEATKRTSDSANAGSTAALSVNDKMDIISQTTKEGAEKIKALKGKSQEIGKIVETINDISEKTNLLALNASIEAARAGDAGRGFAVVADEVKKLAEESGKATGQISDLINNIQAEIQGSVDSMERNTTEVEQGTTAVLEAVKAFRAIPELIEQVNKTLTDMAAVAQQNAAGSQQVSSSITQVSAATQQVSSAAQQLSSVAEELKSVVDKFKLDINVDQQTVSGNDKPATARNAHKAAATA